MPLTFIFVSCGGSVDPRSSKIKLDFQISPYALILCCVNQCNGVIRFEVFTAVLPEVQVFWDVTLCRLVNDYRRFGRA